MKKFVNIYIMLFLIDGLISLVNTLTARIWGIQPLFIMQGIIAMMVFFLSMPLYILVGSMRAFPKRVVLPMVLFTAWAGLFFALPVPIFLGVGNTMLLLSIMQLCLGIVLIVFLRYSAGHIHWLYSCSDFDRILFQWKRFLGFAAANIFLIAPLLGVWLAVSLSLGVSHLSHGFIHLGLRGISTEARTYVYEDKEILLLPTVHIAQPAFYKRLVAPLPVASTVVIPEGVTDKQQLLKEPLDYSKVARRMGLEVQDNQIIVAQRKTALCDVDVSEFSPGTIDYLRACVKVGKYWSSGQRLMALQASTFAAEPNLDLLWQDLLDMRNQRVTACISECLPHYDTIVIPWGAAHMPGIQRTILGWGGTISERRRVPVWHWSGQEKGPDTGNDS